MVRRRANRRRSTKLRRPLKRMMSSYSKGKFIRLSADPPVIPFTTWWPATVLYYFTTSMSVTPKDLFDKLLTQIDGLTLDKTSKSLWCNIRFVSVRAWGKGVPIDLRIHDNDGDNSIFRSSGDMPGMVSFAKVGYVFGSVENQNVYLTSDGNSKILDIVSTKDGPGMAYVSVLIRFRAMSSAIQSPFWAVSSLPNSLSELEID